jgi:alkylation response protein AidB-like acyl-CoA dehydrogenase
MDLRFSPQDEAFRAEVRAFLEAELSGPFASVRGRGGPGDELGAIDERRRWERRLAEAGWAAIAWPRAHGGREATLTEEVLFHEEYARAGGPGRLGHIGETLLGPTLIAHGTAAQQARFLPAIREGSELWCQGYSEPGAGSDLANVQCRAEKVGDRWVITGQKVWTSLAEWSDWCFALCRTDRDAPRHQGISYLLVPMRQPGVTIRPIEQITGTSEFAEVFFDGAETAADNVVGPINGGWKVAMATLAFERGASTLGQQLAFASELESVIEMARQTGAIADPVTRQRLAQAWIGLRIMRLNALRTLSGHQAGTLSRAASITKLYWATWHRDLGKLAIDVMGALGEITGDGPAAGYPLGHLQRLFLWTRCDTIYAGSNQIQREIIGERALGLPREKR